MPRRHEGNGEGGIRTLGSLLGYGALAKRCFRPLSHLTKICSHATRHLPLLQGFGMASKRVVADASREYREELRFSNVQFGVADTDFVAWSRFHRSCQLSIANCARPKRTIGNWQSQIGNVFSVFLTSGIPLRAALEVNPVWTL